eukprot:scaffold3299_cov116-Isochrysis_galbana.AAC.5
MPEVSSLLSGAWLAAASAAPSGRSPRSRPQGLVLVVGLSCVVCVMSRHVCAWLLSLPLLLACAFLATREKKPILAFLATGQHGAAELRVGPDGRLSGRAAVTKAGRRAARGAPNGTIPGLAVAGQQRHHVDIRSAVVSLRLHRGTGEPARFTSQNHITNCSAERCRTPLSHHGAERACIHQDLAAAMPKVTKMILRLSRLDKTRRLHNIRRHPHISSQEHSSDKKRNPSDSGSTGRQKGNHARQGNTQLSSSQHGQYANDPPPHPPDPSGNDG